MEMAAHAKSRKGAYGKLPPMSVAEEFVKADKSNKSYKKVEKVKLEKKNGGKAKRVRRVQTNKAG
jgi:hypothetical protein